MAKVITLVIRGFGETSERRIVEAISGYLERTRRWPIARVSQDVEGLLEHLRSMPGVTEAVAAGSFRRRKDTVGDIDILLAATPGRAFAERLRSFEQVEQVRAQGTTRASVVLKRGLQVDLRIVPPESFGAALVYFTGSKAHNIALRRIALARGLRINEYGVYRMGEGEPGAGAKPRVERGAAATARLQRIAGETEQSVYEAIGLPLIPPELREDQGEIDAARDNRLPQLITRAALHGDLHVHTNACDGRESLEQMARAAREAGLGLGHGAFHLPEDHQGPWRDHGGFQQPGRRRHLCFHLAGTPGRFGPLTPARFYWTKVHIFSPSTPLNEGIIHWHASGMNNRFASD